MLIVPANGSAIVHVPSEEGTPVTEGGLPAVSVPGIRVMGREGDCEVLLVGSGSYQFKSFYETSRHK
ncbi:hypothetical protein [Paenibacillus alba]|uniref:Uncharacterized protein n=1 Tax=Paenibacillus alba TaxID=1197127 RepID=A0ABU6GAY2_9BACL|nr:hypothetical protein [Paenibacillus alba]MEC0229963.1 hypothetical protein [Paenibacillus alba]